MGWGDVWCTHILIVSHCQCPFSLFPGIFCLKHLNWILKTTDLTESSGGIDERPVKNGESDRVNPQTRHRGRRADTLRLTEEKKADSQTNHAVTPLPVMHCPGFLYRCLHSCIRTFHLQVMIQVHLCIHTSWEKCSDYNHTSIVRNKWARQCLCGGHIQVLIHLKVKRIPE